MTVSPSSSHPLRQLWRRRKIYYHNPIISPRFNLPSFVVLFQLWHREFPAILQKFNSWLQQLHTLVLILTVYEIVSILIKSMATFQTPSTNNQPPSLRTYQKYQPRDKNKAASCSCSPRPNKRIVSGSWTGMKVFPRRRCRHNAKCHKLGS